MHKSTHIVGGETPDLAGSVEASPPAASPGETAKIIPFRKATSAAFVGFEDEEADQWEPIGFLAVRMLARWSLPRIVVRMGAPEDAWEESDPPGL